jgi:histidinol-phosphatase (PHP family)
MLRKSLMLTDYHTHTPLCLHAEGNPVEYARHAQCIGLAEIGLSDHNPMPEFFDDWRMLITDLPRYFELVDEARVALPGFPIRLALECDHLEGREKWIDKTTVMADWDYLIGSVHYIHDGIAVDDPKHVSLWKSATDIEHMWKMYWKLYEQMIRTGQFDFYAHPDLAKRFGLRPAGDLRRYYDPVIQALLDTNGVLEVSTAGLRKDVREIYPAREMLEMAFSAKVPIVINSDAHKPTDVGVDYNQALELVRSVGYTTAVRFEKRQRKEVPLPERWPL